MEDLRAPSAPSGPKHPQADVSKKKLMHRILNTYINRLNCSLSLNELL